MYVLHTHAGDNPHIHMLYLFVPVQHHVCEGSSMVQAYNSSTVRCHITTSEKKHSAEILSHYREIVQQGFRILAMALQPVVIMMHYSPRFCVPNDGNTMPFLEVNPETSPQALEGRMLLWHIRSNAERYAGLFNESVYNLRDNINNLIGVSPMYDEGPKRRSLPYDPPPDTHEEAEKKIDAMLKFLLHARDGLEKSHFDELAKYVGSRIPELLSLLPSLESSNSTIPPPTQH